MVRHAPYSNTGATSGYENCTLFNATGIGQAALTVLGRAYLLR